MSSKTSNIIQFCEFEWFEWAMSKKETAPYPNDHFRLGRYLGLGINVSPFLITKIINENGQVLHRSKYQALTQKEWEWEECKAKHSSFVESLYQRLGPHAEARDLVGMGVEVTLQYDPYEDESQNAKTFPMLDKETEVTQSGGTNM